MNPKAHTTVVLGDVQAFTGVVGESIVFSSDALRNIYHSMMMIDEIRFWAVPNGVIGNSDIINQVPPLDIFQDISVQFDVHGYKMSSGPVNVDLLCTDFQTALEQEFAPNRQAIYHESFRRWIPPEPIILPPGDSLLTRLTAPTGITGFNIWVVVVGRISDDDTPETARVPYIIQYPPTVGSADSIPGLVQGGLTQFTVPVFALQNPLDRDLMLQRIIARLRVHGGGAHAAFNGRDVLRELPDFLQIELTDSQNYTIAKSVDIGAFVDATRRAWTFKRALESHGYLKAQFTLNTAQAQYANLTAIPLLCLVGSREEVIR